MGRYRQFSMLSGEQLMRCHSIRMLMVLVAGVCFGIPVWAADAEEQSMAHDPMGLAAREAIRIALEKKGGERKADADFHCVDLGHVAVILHPDTELGRIEEIRNGTSPFLFDRGKVQYNRGGRWSSTATNSSTGLEGDPITLLWGFLPDGVIIPGDSLDRPSNLHAVFDTVFNTPQQWKNKMRTAMRWWGDAIGITLIEVDYDDGAPFPGSRGITGVRPDVRIGGRSVDGVANVLAYNYFPDSGDMVIDTDDAAVYYVNPSENYRTLKNVTAHEHGHGLGLGHTTPDDGTKLMGGLDSPLVGPQDDEIRGGQRLYGDILENNDSSPDASILLLPADTLLLQNLSIDRGQTDIDWYRIIDAYGTVRIEVDPVGSTYLIGDEGGPPPEPIATDSITDLDFEIYDSTGALLLAVADSATLGETEMLDFPAPYAGDYFLKVFRREGTGGAIQRYTLLVHVDAATGLVDRSSPASIDLRLAVSPNPFNAKTRIRFFLPGAEPYSVRIYNPTGRLVRELEGRSPGGGPVQIDWDGTDRSGKPVATGTYLFHLNTNGRAETGRAVLLR